MSQSSGPVKVCYIMGDGRSGSTVLDMILGAHPDVVGCGELTNLVEQGFLDNQYCSCGEKVGFCPFWGEVKDRFLAEAGPDAMNEYARVRWAVEPVRRWPLSAGAWRVLMAGPWPRYQELCGTLFNIIARVSGKSMIVDSSKNPARALALAGTTGVDLRLVHLVRDGRGVLWSHKKRFARNLEQGIETDMEAEPSWKAATRWALTNAFALYVDRTAGGLFLRYESLVEEPSLALTAIGGLTEVDYSGVEQTILRGEAVEAGHVVAGNRVRMKGPVRLRADYAWKEALPKKDRAVFAVLAGPLSAYLDRKYGKKPRFTGNRGF